MSLSQPMKTYRLTWDELMSRRNEIAPGAVLEVKVYQPVASSQVDSENQALISLLQSWREEDAIQNQNTQQLERWKAETEELMENLQANRVALRGQE